MRDSVIRRIRRTGALSMLFVALLGTSAYAATNIEEGQDSLPAVAAARPASFGAALVDLDGNGISDGLETRLGTLRDDDVVDVVVTFVGPGNAASAKGVVGAFDVIREFTLIDGFAASVTVGQARALSQMSNVFRVEEVFQVQANLETARPDFGVAAVQAGLAGGSGGLEGAGIGICVVDSGARGSHIAFSADGASNNSDLRIVAFYNALQNGASTEPGANSFDDFGHGTHVAAIAAGDKDGDPAEFDGRLYGVAPKADLYIAKALDSGGGGSGPDAIEAIEWCVAQEGVNVINLSFGTIFSSDGQDALSLAVNNAVSVEGKVVVVAAGNTGANPYTIGSPAAAEMAIAVGAVSDWSRGTFNHNFESKGGVNISAFSSRGPTADERIKPDIMGPGFDIASAYNRDDTDYAIMSGTSMSSPYVTGVVALMLDANGALAPSDIKQFLYDTAQDRGPLVDNLPAKDNDYGHGVVDAAAAVGMALNLSPLPQTAFPRHFIGEGDIVAGAMVGGPISIPGDDAASMSLTLLLDGDVECILDLGPFGCFGAEWRPDLDARLLDPNSANVDESTCMVGTSTECGTADSGRQETLTHRNSLSGDYTLEVYMGTADYDGGHYSYEVSTGPLEVGPSVFNPSVSGQPVVVISAPADGTTIAEDTSLTFAATADDPEDGDLAASIAWTSSLDAGIGSGGSFATSTLSAGTHTITASATDSGGLTGSDSITVTVTAANAAPVVSITAPANNSSFAVGEPVSITGTASDTEDGTITSGLAWTSSLDGSIGAGGGFTTSTLSAGSHTITASVTDSGSLEGTDSIEVTITSTAPNSPPTALIAGGDREIKAAKGGTTDVTFNGTVSDPDNLNFNYYWTVDGATWAPATDATNNPELTAPTIALSKGVHTIMLVATDSGGLQGTASVCIDVFNKNPSGACGGGSGNATPTVSISAPADSAVFTVGDSVAFAGSADDAEDGDVTSDLAWTSSIDGAIGTGGSFSYALSAGTHTITASITDNGGATGSDTVTVTVQTADGLTPMFVSDIKFKQKGPNLTGTVVVSPAVGNAMVRVSFCDSANPQVCSFVDNPVATSGKGEASFMVRYTSPPYTLTVIDVVPPNGYTYDPGSNLETDDTYG